MKQISRWIVTWCQNKNRMSEEQFHIVEYGIQLLLNTSLKILTIGVIGGILGYFNEVVIAMFVFGSIRYFAGGYHFKTDMGCLGFMLLMCLSPIPMFRVELYLSKWIWRAISIFSIYEILRYAPRNSKVNPILDYRILKKKRVGSLAVLMIWLLFISLCQSSDIGWLISIPMFVETVTISPLLCGTKYGT